MEEKQRQCLDNNKITSYPMQQNKFKYISYLFLHATRDGLTIGHLGTCPRTPHIDAPLKNDQVLKTMNQNSVKLRPVLLLPEANISL